MTTRNLLLSVGLVVFFQAAFGQQTETFRLSLTAEKEVAAPSYQSGHSLSIFSPETPNTGYPFEIQSWTIRPGFVEQNPTGDTYLCRLEDQLEATMNIPVWINTKDERIQRVNTAENIKVLFKLVRF